MDSYVVRIYRRVKDNPRMLIGIVQQVGDEAKNAFSNFDELWSILSPVKENARKLKKSKAPK